MEFIYWVFIKIYGLVIKMASLFNGKAKDWVTGRRFYFQALKHSLPKEEQRIWFHCSSLGEFEQGLPLLQELRNQYPEYKIVLTFFSPSGYNIKKNDAAADYIYYLPLDGPANSSKFIELVNPSLAFFVKYEFWHFYIKALHKKKIPVFVISAIFRPSQIYFKWYGFFFYAILRRVTHLFVQDQASLILLYNNRLANVTVSGDTRFDRVVKNKLIPNPVNGLNEFKNNQPILIAGSTWPADEALLIQMINTWQSNWKYIIVPHEINSTAIEKMRWQISLPTILYSELSEMDQEQKAQKQVLIIDNIGLLSRLYVYGNIAYIGGGFGAGIHNILEAAVFGLPVVFGPKYQKFKEANEMVDLRSAFSIHDYTGLYECIKSLAENELERKDIATENLHYIESKCGATNIIIDYLKMNYPKLNTAS